MDNKEFYKERIIKLITECESDPWLKVIYTYVKRLLIE